jgi:hypothetical protein
MTTTEFYITADVLLAAIRNLPATTIWMNVDLDFNRLCLYGADKYFTVLSYTEREVVVGGSPSEYAVKFLDYDSLLSLFKSICDDEPQTLVTFTYPDDCDEPKLKLKWKVGQKKRTATFRYERDIAPAPITFSVAESVQLLPDDRKVLQAHGDIAATASEDEYAGVQIQYQHEPDENNSTLTLVSTDSFRILRSKLSLVEAMVPQDYTIALPDTAIPPLCKMHANVLRLDLVHAVWEVTIGDYTYLVKTITKANLKTINVDRFFSISRLPLDPTLRDRQELLSYHTFEIDVEAQWLALTCELASKLTIPSKAIYLSAEENTIHARGVANESGNSHAQHKATSKMIGRQGSSPLSYKLLRTALKLADKESIIHCVLNPVGPNLFEWGAHEFAIMPMVIKGDEDESENADDKVSSD